MVEIFLALWTIVVHLMFTGSLLYDKVTMKQPTISPFSPLDTFLPCKSWPLIMVWTKQIIGERSAYVARWTVEVIFTSLQGLMTQRDFSSPLDQVRFPLFKSQNSHCDCSFFLFNPWVVIIMRNIDKVNWSIFKVMWT